MPMTRFQSIATRVCAGLILAGIFASGSACNIVAPIVYVVHGPPKVKAIHELDPELKTVIFVDDRANKLPRRSLKNVIGKSAEELMISKGVILKENMIASRSATLAASSETDSELMSIADIGKAVGVDRVIYVKIEGFSISRDGTIIEPVAGAFIKVIDTAENKRLWPSERTGFPVKIQLPPTGSQIPTQRAGVNRIQIGVAESLGVQIARIFYEYERDALSTSPTG